MVGSNDERWELVWDSVYFELIIKIEEWALTKGGCLPIQIIIYSLQLYNNQ